MSTWVRGPIPIDGRSLDVYEGTACVILRNGEVYDVRGPGRHGGLLRTLDEHRRLPYSGSLEVLTFEQAPAVSDPVTVEVRLRDGATVEVTMRAAIVPLWQKDPQTIADVVRRYGVEPNRIEELARLELEGCLRVTAISSLSGLTHDQVHAAADLRRLLRPAASAGLLTVGDIVACSITRDRQAEAAHQTVRDGELSRLGEIVAGELAALEAFNQNTRDAIARQGQIQGELEARVAAAQIDALVGEILGITAADVALPGQRDARLQAKYDTVRGVLENNLDLLPLLADASENGSTGQMADLIATLFDDGLAGGAAPTIGLGAGRQGLPAPDSEAGRRVRRRAVVPGPYGPFEILVVDGGTDQTVGSIGGAGPHRILLAHGDDPIDLSMRALSAAARWCGVQVGAKVLSPASARQRGRVALTRVVGGASAPAGEVERSLGTWIAAINAVLAGAVEVEAA